MPAIIWSAVTDFNSRALLDFTAMAWRALSLVQLAPGGHHADPGLVLGRVDLDRLVTASGSAHRVTPPMHWHCATMRALTSWNRQTAARGWFALVGTKGL